MNKSINQWPSKPCKLHPTQIPLASSQPLSSSASTERRLRFHRSRETQTICICRRGLAIRGMGSVCMSMHATRIDPSGRLRSLALEAPQSPSHRELRSQEPHACLRWSEVSKSDSRRCSLLFGATPRDRLHCVPSLPSFSLSHIIRRSGMHACRPSSLEERKKLNLHWEKSPPDS